MSFNLNLTTSQIFQIGAAIMGFVTLVLSTVHGVDPVLVAKIGGGAVTCWTSVGAILTDQSAQVKSVVARADEPAVQEALVRTVSKYEGVDPIQTNENASQALINVAADKDFPKVLLPKS